jgi:hypothetical protein
VRNPFNRGAWLVLGCVTFFVVTNSLSCVSLSLYPDWLYPELAIGGYVACMSAIGAQMALHGIWCALGQLRWTKRLAVGATSGLVLYGGVVAGWMALPSFLECDLDGDDLFADAMTGLFCLPLLALASQMPLWIMRIWFRWRIAHRDHADPSRLQPLRIGHLLVAMTVVAGALAAARVSQSTSSSRENEGIVALAAAALVIAVVSATTTVPAVLVCLRARRLPLALGLIFAADVAVYVALAIILGGGSLDWQLIKATLVFAGGYFVTLTAPMLIARRLGYRLLWGRG